MFTIVLNDALEGVDIFRRYPAFYRRLLAEPALRRKFLDALAILQDHASGSLPALPDASGLDPAFLREKEIAATVAQARPPAVRRAGSGWHVSWEAPVAFLRQLFGTPPGPTAATRSVAVLGDETLSLLRSQVPLGELTLDLSLEAIWSAVAPDTVSLQLWLADGGGAILPPVGVSLRWGSYRQDAALDSSGRLSLPALPLAEILDEGTATVRSPLRLSLAIPD